MLEEAKDRAMRRIADFATLRKAPMVSIETHTQDSLPFHVSIVSILSLSMFTRKEKRSEEVWQKTDLI